jgi:hypothetical protein
MEKKKPRDAGLFLFRSEAQNNGAKMTDSRLSHAQANRVTTKVMGRLNLLKGFIASLRLGKFAQFYFGCQGLSTANVACFNPQSYS